MRLIVPVATQPDCPFSFYELINVLDFIIVSKKKKKKRMFCYISVTQQDSDSKQYLVNPKQPN